MQGEDAFFNLEILLNKPQIFYCKEVVYGYFNFKNTLRGRWRKNPESMCKDYIDLYSRKIDLSNTYLVDEYDIIKLKRNYVKILFRVSLNYYRFSKNFKCEKAINDEIRKLHIQFSKLKIGEKIKYLILRTKVLKMFKVLNKVCNKNVR